jgi:iron-sulfur cluster assembly protein
MVITLTEKAISEIKRIVQDDNLEQDKVALRVRVVGGGCSGFQTKLDLDEEFDEKKDFIFFEGGVRVAVDKRSAMYIEGATVDFHEDINKRGFVVNNPNAKTTCGCGSSFSM